MTKQLQILIDKQKNIEKPQEQARALNMERSPSTHSDTEHINSGEDTAADKDPPVRRNVQRNEEDSNAAEDEEPSGKQHGFKGTISDEVEAACEKL